MRGKGEYQRKLAEKIDRAVYLAILKNGPVFFNQLYRILKDEEAVRSTRTLTKSLKRLMKRGRIARELAVLHLHHPNVLNPPILEPRVVLGRWESEKFIPDKNAPQKLIHELPQEPADLIAWQKKLNRLILGKKKVYVVKIKTEIRP